MESVRDAPVDGMPKAKGAYGKSVCAKDTAGNAQRRVGSAKAVVT